MECDTYLVATLRKAAKRGRDGLKSQRALSGQQSVVVKASGGPGAVHRRELGAMQDDVRVQTYIIVVLEMNRREDTGLKERRGRNPVVLYPRVTTSRSTKVWR